MTVLNKQEWLEYYDKTKEDDFSLLQELLKKSATNSDGTEAMKFAQAAVSFTQAVSIKYERMLKRGPRNVWRDDGDEDGK